MTLSKKKRKLHIVEVTDNDKHPGQELYDQLLARIKERQAIEGSLSFEGGFFTAMDLLAREADPIEALSWYGQLAEWLEKTVSRDRHKKQESLARFLASRP